MTRPQSLTTTPGATITQTYATADTTMPAAVTGLTLTATEIAGKTASDTLTDSGTADAAAVAASLNQAQKDLGTKINAINADVLAIKKLLNTVIDALQLDNTLS